MTGYHAGMIVYQVPKLFRHVSQIEEHKDLVWEKKWIAMSEEARKGINLPFNLTMTEQEMKEANDDEEGHLMAVLRGAEDLYETYGRLDYAYLRTQCPHCNDQAWGTICDTDFNKGCQTINRCRKCQGLFIAVYHQPRTYFYWMLLGFILTAILLAALVDRA